MSIRCVKFAFVSAAFLAAFATNSGTAFAASSATDTARAGFSALQQGDAGKAISHFTIAIESRSLEPEMLANALINRALAFQQQGKDKLAIDDYTAALSLDAMSPSLRATALYNRGLSRQKQGDLSPAIQDFTSALLLNPEFAHAFYNRGNALRDSGQLLFALSDYERAVRFKHPDEARVHYGAAMAYVALRRPKDAKKALAAALALKPNFAQARDQLAKLGKGAEVAETEADPILTGSVAAFAGAGVAKKAELPKAVDVPANLLMTGAGGTGPKVRKKYKDRFPGLESAPVATLAKFDATAPAAAKEVVVEVDQVPEIPKPEKKPRKAKLVLTEEPVVETAPVAEVAEPVEVAKVEEPAQASEAASGYLVQIASEASEDDAKLAWKRLKKKHSILGEHSPSFVRAEVGERVVYRVRIQGFSEAADAKSLCSSLKKKGLDCYVDKT